MEHALDPSYASRCGVNVDSLLISQPDMGEQALEITETLVRSGAVDVIVIDSVAALVPRAEIEGDMGDSPMGMQARLMSQALRKLSGRYQTDQHRRDLHQSAAPEDRGHVRQSGDDHRRHGAQILCLGAPGCAPDPIDQARGRDHRQPDPGAGGQEQSCAPFRTAEFDIMYNEGISTAGDILDLGVGLDIVTKRGSFYSYGDLRLGQGRENSKEYLNQNPDLAEEIELTIRQQALSGVIPAGFSGDEEDAGGLEEDEM
jgi:recombination protein RecA